MARYHLTQDHFHYDNSGYYGYILFSGTNAELHELLKALGRSDKAPHGFGWHRFGESFRPADNGIVYDYYIRLRGKGNIKPSAAAVDEFLRKTIPSRDPIVQASKRALEEHKKQQSQAPVIPSASPTDHPQNPPPWAEQLRAKVDALDKLLVTGIQQLNENTLRLGEGLPRLNDKFNQLQDSFTPLNTSITRLSKDLAESQLVAERAKGELTAKENELKNLKAELALAKEQLAANPNGSVDKSAGPNQAIQQLEDELKKVEAKKQEIEKEYAEKNALLEKQVKNWQASNNEQAKELSRLKKRVQEAQEKKAKENTEGKNGNINKRNFRDILDGISPNFVFVRGSFDTLYQEVNDYRFVFQRLCAIVYDPSYNGRNAFRGTRRGGGIPRGSNAHIKWREDRVGNNHWRIYFCKDRRVVGDKFVVLISEKDDQKSDEEWVVKNDPSTLI